MRHRARLASRIEELQTRWDRLSQVLQALQQQRDLETRAEERLRLDSLIAPQEVERQQVAAQLQDMEQEFRTLRNADGAAPSPPASPEAQPIATPTRPVKIFYSYSHKDEALRDQLERHLAVLQRQSVISGWYDRAIQAGTEWERQINEHMESADIILLLVSADFIASDYCWGKEVKRAMERHATGAARVIPILLRAVNWTGAPFSKLQALPKDARPVTSWPNQDEAFADITRGIRQVAATWTHTP